MALVDGMLYVVCCTSNFNFCILNTKSRKNCAAFVVQERVKPVTYFVSCNG